MSQIRAAVSVVKGSPTVTTTVNLAGSVGTGFMFALSGAREAYYVAATPVWDGSVCTVQLTAPFAGDTNSVASGLFVTDYTTPDMIPVIAPGDTNTATIFTEAMYRLQKMITTVSPDGLATYMKAHDEVISAASAASSSATNSANSAANSASSASSAAASASAAATSATATSSSKADAATSATAAASSASSSANSAKNASDSASAAASSASSSANNATSSATSATNASSSASSAAASASAAAASASNASSSASGAASSASAAQTYKSQASTSATNASGAAANASQYASDASGFAGAAQAWATQTSTEVVAGQGYGAKKYAQDAANSASAAAGSASTASTAQAGAQTAKTASETARDLAAKWATQTTAEVVAGQGYGAKKYAQDANASSGAASTSAAAAAGSASAASTSATNSANSAAAAAVSATSASSSATSAANSAATAATNTAAASGSAGSAASSATTATAARDKAKSWADSEPGVEVEPGKYSAKHWASIAAGGTVGQMVFKGAFDASSNGAPASPLVGQFYRISVAGLVGGTLEVKKNDSIYYNGTGWDKIDNTESVSSVNGMVGDVVISAITGNAGTASKLATARTLTFIGDATGAAQFDGSGDVSITLSIASLAFSKLSGKPTTLSGYGITDAQPALGYAPVNRAGDTMTGGLIAPGISVTQSGAYEANLSFSNSNVRAFYFASVADRSGFSFCYCDDSGAYKSSVYSVNRASGATTFYHDIIANTNASVAGTLSVAGSASIAGALTVGSGITGLIARPYTSGSWGALYSAGVTPSGTNYAFASCADSTLLNAPIGSIGLRVANGADVVSVTASSVGVSQPLTSSSSITAATLKSTGNTTVAGGLTVSGAATVAGNAVLHAGNYSSYALPRDGSQLFNGVLGTYVSAPGGDSNMGTVTAFGFSRGSTGADQYLKIATLPVSSSSTRDHLVISGVFDDTWASWQKNRYEITLSNRNSFSYQYQLFGNAHTGSVIKAYQETDGSVSVWAATLGTTWSTINLNITHAVGCTIYKDGIAGTPTGTLVFDSSLPGTYQPQLWVGTDGTTLKSYGKNILHSGNYNSYSPTLTGGGASGTWNINALGYSQAVYASGDGAIKNSQSAASGAGWVARNISTNPTVDRAAFTGVWNDSAVVAAHNASLGAWAPLYVNTVSGQGGGTVYLGQNANVLDSGGSAWPILHQGNFTNYTVNLTNGVAPEYSGQDLNALSKAGFYRGYNFTNAPEGNTGWYWITVQSHDNKGSADGWTSQTAISYGSGNTANRMWTRVKAGNSWTAWEEILKPSSDITAKRISTSVGGAGSAVLVSAGMADNDGFRILVGGTATNAGYAEIATADDGSEPIYVRQYTGAFANCVRTLKLLDENGDTTVPKNLIIARDGSTECQLHLRNGNRDVFYYLNTTGENAGLWDATAGHARWVTDSVGNFTANGRVTAQGAFPQMVCAGTAGNTGGISLTNDSGKTFSLGIGAYAGNDTYFNLYNWNTHSHPLIIDQSDNATFTGVVRTGGAAGGPKFVGTKAGNSYGDGTAVFRAVLDNPNGSASYLFEGFCGGESGTRTHYVRADGCGYFATDVAVGSGTSGLHIGNVYPGGGWGSIYSTNVTPTVLNHSFLTNGTDTHINAPSGTLHLVTNGAARAMVTASAITTTVPLIVAGRVAAQVGGLPDTATTDGTNQLLASDGGSGNAAKIGLVRDGRYGINIGLDSDNVFRVGGWSDGATYRFQADTAGNFTARANITAYSDERVKTNWRGLGENFIDRLAAVKHGVYDRTDADLTQVGVSAQSLREVMPEAVLEGQDGQLSVAYGNAALAAVIELAAEVKALRAEIAELKRAA